MSFPTHFHGLGNAINLRWVDDQGRHHTDRITNWGPTLYTTTNEKDSQYKSLTGENLKQLPFDSIKDAKNFIDEYGSVEGFRLFGNDNWAYQYVDSRWPEEHVSYDETKIKVYYLDIETEVGNEFPEPKLALQRINLITAFDGSTFHVWSFKDTELNDTEYGYPVVKHCLNREDMMLRSFVSWMEGNPPDVLSGWNSAGFDLLYIVRRVRSQLGEDWVKKLSPFGRVSERDHKEGDGVDVTLHGIEHLDYMLLFKKFIPGEREWSLDSVAEDILSENKLHNPFSTFREFYENDWPTFSRYNVRDVQLLVKLDAKLKLMSLCFSVAYMTKVNYTDVLGTVKVWDAFIQNYLRSKNQFVQACYSPPPPADRQIAGGFVMDPKTGRHAHVVSFDATSLYPSIVRTFNMSTETLVQPEELPEELRPWFDRIQIDEIVAGVDENLSQLLGKHNLSMAANGQFFRRDKQGIIAKLIGDVFNARVAAKNEMKRWKKELVELKDKDGADEKSIKHAESMLAALDNRQLALKILANSAYGALASRFFRFYDFRLAEGITTTGQSFIQRIGQEAAAYVDKLAGTTGSAIYTDTDSVYLGLDDVVKKIGLDKKPIEERITPIDEFCKAKLGKKIAASCERFSSDLNTYERHLEMKREKICEAGVWVAKKRYVLLAWDDEGVRYHEPKIAVTGLEVKRSSTPKVVRKALGDALIVFAKGTEEELHRLVKNAKQDFMASPLVEIAIPSGVNGLKEKSDAKNIYQKGCPQHVRASLLYNHYLKQHKIEGKYNPILEGGKMKRVPLVMPNPIKENVIGFIDKLPEEFGLTQYIDFDELFEKTFIQAADRIAQAVGWTVEPKASLESWFG